MFTAKEKADLQVEAILNDHVRNIWGFVRENADSLDSERACKLIRDGLDTAAFALVPVIEGLSAKVDELNGELRSAKGSLAKARADIMALEAKLPQKKKEAEKEPASAR